jgi:hypothetical protein
MVAYSMANLMRCVGRNLFCHSPLIDFRTALQYVFGNMRLNVWHARSRPRRRPCRRAAGPGVGPCPAHAIGVLAVGVVLGLGLVRNAYGLYACYWANPPQMRSHGRFHHSALI